MKDRLHAVHRVNLVPSVRKQKPLFRSVDEARRLARKRLPPAVYHFIQGGKEHEVTALANELAFNRILFSPRICSVHAQPGLETTVFGKRISMPIIIAPTGLVRLIHGDGELGAARAAAAAGIPIAISTLCGEPAASVVTVNPQTWFQLYMIGGRRGAAECISRAHAAGCQVLIVTVDFAGFAPEDRLARTLPKQMSLAAALAFFPEVWNRPRWLLSFLNGGFPTRAPNAPRSADGSFMLLADASAGLLAALPSWEDLAWIRSTWKGPLVIKGILRADDACRAADIGADGIVVSNHGAKMLDGSPSTLSVLPEIVDAVGRRVEVLLDGGVRRGSDVVRACALGAKAVLIGRPYLWGLASGGEHGVLSILELFRRGLLATLAQLGCPSIEKLDRTSLRSLPDFNDWNEVGINPLAARY